MYMADWCILSALQGSRYATGFQETDQIVLQGPYHYN